MPVTRQVGGVPAAALVNPRDGGPLYLALHGPALPLRIDSPGGRGSMLIADYGQPVKLTAPHGALDLTSART